MALQGNAQCRPWRRVPIRDSTRVFSCRSTKKTREMTKIDNRITANDNDHEVLKSLNRFASATPKMLSVLHWRDAAQGDAMARRTLHRLLDKKLVLKRQAEGNTLWVLSASGARLLREQYDLDA